MEGRYGARKGDSVKNGNVTTQEEGEILTLYKNGTTIGEIALLMDRGVGTIVRTLGRLNQIKESEYEHLVEMPLKWVADWLAIYKRYGNHER